MWDDVVTRLSEAVKDVSWGRFLVLDYDPGDSDRATPYAQLANTGGDPLCEVVSAWHLPASLWPLDEVALRRAGWSPPCGNHLPNWWRFDLAEPEEIARGLLEGLRVGRACTDPEAFRWHIGLFSPGPGDGEEIPEGAGAPALQLVA